MWMEIFYPTSANLEIKSSERSFFVSLFDDFKAIKKYEFLVYQTTGQQVTFRIVAKFSVAILLLSWVQLSIIFAPI